MISRALAALALGGSLFILLPGSFQILEAQQTSTVSLELIDRYRQTLATDQDNLTLHYLLGVALLQDIQDEAALAELQTAYPAYQESIEAHYNLAIASLRLGDLLSAEIYLDQAVALGAAEMPDLYPVADLYFNLAIKTQEAGDAKEAIRYFHNVLTLSPKRYEIYRQLGDLYAQRNDTELAVLAFRKYLEQFPNDPVSQDYLFALEFNRAQDFMAANDLANASKGFSASLEIQPESTAALFYLGYIDYTQGRHDAAAVLLTRAFFSADESLRQTIRPLLYNSALSLRQADRSAEALEAIAILADREDAQFNECFLAGTLNLDLGSHITASAYLQRAVASRPDHAGAKKNLLAAELGAFDEWLAAAKNSIHAEKFNEADIALQKAVELQPQNSQTRLVKMQIYRARHTRASAYFTEAQSSLDTGDYSTALDKVKLGLAVQPDNPEGASLRNQINAALNLDMDKLLAAAELALQAKDWPAATGAYDQALSIAPQNPNALAGYERAINARHQEAISLQARGQKALDTGEINQSIALFQQLLKLEPDSEQASNGLNTAQQIKMNRLDEFLRKGRQAMDRERFAEARQWFGKAAAIDAAHASRDELARLERLVQEKADALTIQAEQAARDGKYKQAGKLLQQAQALMPNHRLAALGAESLTDRINEAIADQQQQAVKASERNDDVTAMSAYRKILDIAPGNNQALKGLEDLRQKQDAELSNLVRQGREALAAGELTKAGDYLKEALQLDAYHKDAQELRQRLEQVRLAGAQPGDEQTLYLQGVVFYTQGKYAEAVKAWETVLLLNPDHEKASQNIEKTKRKMRQLEEYRGS